MVRADRWSPGCYAAVADRDWDAVVDVTWQPELVRSALAALASSARHWIYVSSVSVYRAGAEHAAGAIHEPWTGIGVVDIEDYASAKVSCEAACREALPDQSVLIARSGLIAGHGDRSERFGYWPTRISAVTSGDQVVLVPPVEHPAQVIDVEDLAGWLADCAERRTAGTFDAVGDQITLGDVVSACATVAHAEPTLAEPDQEWLLAKGVNPWAGPDSLPLWLPLPESSGMMSRDNTDGKTAGLTLRPLADTVASSLAWETELGLERERHAGLSRRREQALLLELLGPTDTCQ